MSIIKEYFYNIECDVCGECADVTCWHYDDDDNIVTKDGRKFNGDTEEEIL